jgi:hypothetical protein
VSANIVKKKLAIKDAIIEEKEEQISQLLATVAALKEKLKQANKKLSKMTEC